MKAEIKQKVEKGITLIELVITIIVLLILAGVTIATLTGDNGILTQASNAKEETEQTNEKELIELAVMAAKSDGQGVLTTDNLNREMKRNFNNDKMVRENGSSWIYENEHIYKISEDGKVELVKPILPEEYQQVEYIESTGTQYIDTGIPSQAGLTIKAEITSLNNNIHMIPLGCNWGLYVEINKGYFMADWGGFEVPATLNEKYIVIAQQTEENNRVVTIGEYSTTATNKSSRSDNVYLFGLNDMNKLYKGSGDTSNTCAAFQGRIGKTEFYVSNEIKRNFIPCYRKSDNVIGMYDTVEGKLYINQGSESFIKGEDV